MESKQKQSDSKDLQSNNISRKRNYVLILLEIFTVSFGVMLGFFINQLKEERKIEKNRTTAIELIHNEIIDNLKESEEIFLKNKDAVLDLYKMNDSIDFFINDNKSLFQLLKKDIVIFASNTTAWEAFKQQGLASQTDFKQVADLAEIYTILFFIDKSSDQLVKVLSNSDFFDPAKLNPAYLSFRSQVTQHINFGGLVRNEIVEYLEEYEPESLKDTISFDSLRLSLYTELREIMSK